MRFLQRRSQTAVYARKRRGGVRRVVLSVVGGALFITCAVIGYYMAQPPPLPVVEVAAARFALHQARTAPPLAAPQLALADTLGLKMERLFAQERSKLVRFRRSAPLARAISDATLAANAARQAADDSLASGLAAGRRRGEELAARLELVTAQVETMPGEKRLQRVHKRAQVALDLVEQLALQSELSRLPVALDTAEAAVSRAEDLLGTRLARLHDPHLKASWQKWIDQTVAETGSGGMAVLVEKLRRRCVVVQNRRVIARYSADFGRNGLSDKLHSGDGATPEGRYRVVAKNDTSRYFKALLLDYPNAGDLASFREARRQGLIPRGRGPGGLIEIHGNGGRNSDWTEGCIALRNDDMAELFRKVPVGTPITIVGAARLPGD